MPRIDDGSTDGPPGRRLQSAWVTLTVVEARELLESLRSWEEEAAAAELVPGWHSHVADSDGNELTIAVEPEEPR